MVTEQTPPSFLWHTRPDDCVPVMNTLLYAQALAELSDLVLIMPKDEIYRIQEDHLAVYHLLCAVVEYEMFDV